MNAPKDNLNPRAEAEFDASGGSAAAMSVQEARQRRVCRICGQPISTEGWPRDAFRDFASLVYPERVTLSFGCEFAHEKCLPDGQTETTSPVLSSELVRRPVVALGQAPDGTIVVTDVLCMNFPDMTNEQMAALSWKLGQWSREAKR